MRYFILLILIIGTSKTSHCKVFEKCELAFVLANKHNVSEWDVQNLVCIAEYESNFNASDFNDANFDSSKDFGLFHINDRYWCGSEFGKNVCNATCEAFLDDDLTDDLACVEEITSDTKSWKDPEDGYVAWSSYENSCKVQNLTEYLAECETWSPDKQKPTEETTTITSLTSSIHLSSNISSTTTEKELNNVTTTQNPTMSTTMSSSSFIYSDDGNLNTTIGAKVNIEFESENENISTTESVRRITHSPSSIDSSSINSSSIDSSSIDSSSIDSKVKWTVTDVVSTKLYIMIQNWLNFKKKLPSEEHF